MLRGYPSRSGSRAGSLPWGASHGSFPDGARLCSASSYFSSPPSELRLVLYFYEAVPGITGSSTEEFLPEENPADTTTAATTTTPPPKPALEAQWPTYGRDIQGTHVSPAKHRPPYRQIWMHRARHYIEFPPVVAYDKIFVAQQRGRFYALNAKTGKQLWTKNFGRCAAASPTIWRGVVYQVLMHELPCPKHKPAPPDC